jgi:hypothetical protein
MFAVEEICKTLAASFPGITFEMGPPKQQKRILEKVVMKEGRFDKIYDYARGTFVVDNKALGLIHDLVKGITEVPAISVVRAKNRLDPIFDSSESGGYRDYQMIVRVKHPEHAGWLVEIQIVPREILNVRSQAGGHKDYTAYRFVIEAANRAEKKQQLLHSGAVKPSCTGEGQLYDGPMTLSPLDHHSKQQESQVPPWFVGQMGRVECDELVAAAGQNRFLVRKSTSRDAYVITVNHKGKIIRFVIRFQMHTGVYTVAGKRFRSLEAAVQFLIERGIQMQGTTVNLTTSARA